MKYFIDFVSDRDKTPFPRYRRPTKQYFTWTAEFCSYANLLYKIIKIIVGNNNLVTINLIFKWLQQTPTRRLYHLTGGRRLIILYKLLPLPYNVNGFIYFLHLISSIVRSRLMSADALKPKRRRLHCNILIYIPRFWYYKYTIKHITE